jgi:hypothetical protein
MLLCVVVQREAPKNILRDRSKKMFEVQILFFGLAGLQNFWQVANLVWSKNFWATLNFDRVQKLCCLHAITCTSLKNC